MKYAQFYGEKDRTTLMEGVRKFDRNLNEVFKNANNKFPGINQYISISAICYDIARISYTKYCFKLSGKP